MKNPKWTNKDQDIADAYMTGDKAEAEVLQELQRNGIENDPRPIHCDQCNKQLQVSGGFAGETILYCPNHGIKWEDHEGAIRNVF